MKTKDDLLKERKDQTNYGLTKYHEGYEQGKFDAQMEGLKWLPYPENKPSKGDGHYARIYTDINGKQEVYLHYWGLDASAWLNKHPFLDINLDKIEKSMTQHIKGELVNIDLPAKCSCCTAIENHGKYLNIIFPKANVVSYCPRCFKTKFKG